MRAKTLALYERGRLTGVLHLTEKYRYDKQM